MPVAVYEGSQRQKLPALKGLDPFSVRNKAVSSRPDLPHLYSIRTRGMSLRGTSISTLLMLVSSCEPVRILPTQSKAKVACSQHAHILTDACMIEAIGF